jgi:hypothetical protein
MVCQTDRRNTSDLFVSIVYIEKWVDVSFLFRSPEHQTLLF